ncbi:AraC family transcriptional regulator ligand-binding domain-containing protein [Nocardia sp. 2]|uniref:AraC family transcriptional regulator ligand-binding domain-containing protein n=1 Tax=Nocardia acididurans TaxID=2802282 RepID=A0ABS1LZ45_9NOCA|nr:AraC family transcriptional regulator ligand-binding domain-containing protein [Nocardia acididurans]
MLTDQHAFVPTRDYVRLWRPFEHATDDPDIALRVAAASAQGTHGLFGHLFATAPTLGAAMQLYTGPHVGLISSHIRFDLWTPNEQETVFSGPTGSSVELYYETARFGLSGLIVRARRLTGQAIRPVRVSFRCPPPRHSGVYSEIFDCPVDFDAPVDAMTFRSADLALPLRTADPSLAAMLRHYAAILPAPPLRPTQWTDRFEREVDSALTEGNATLELVARRLAVSPRTLQRRLADGGTTWRRELERARHRRLQAAATASLTRGEQASLLGYADTASMRRALRRWASRN